MSQSIFTRCPECHTVFKVTEQHLALAKGRVRCGACLHVFLATEHLVRPKEKSVPQSSSIERTIERTITSDHEHDEIVQPASDEGLLLRASNEAEQAIKWGDKPTSKTAYPIASFGATESAEDEAATDLTGDSQVDEAPHQQVVDDLNADSGVSTEPESAEQAPEPFADIDSAPEPMDDDPSDSAIEDFAIDSFIDDEADEVSDALPYAEDDAANVDVASDGPDDHLEVTTTNSDTESLDLAATVSAASLTPTTPASADEAAEQLAAEMKTEQPTLTDDFSIDRLNDVLADEDFEPDPLDEFDDMVQQKSHALKWTIAAVVLLAGFGYFTAWLWSERQTLAWDETWGSSVQLLCSVAPCELAPRRDIAAIELLQRDIRPSDDDPEITEFNLFIRNNAAFDQPYPTVEIRFTDTKGEIVSTERHLPQDYLASELKDQMMPRNQKTLILIKARQSHANAFGFEFSFL
ncbi:MAG: zinc-ribbon domain-containing protein [Gammaproteobacteria bacterium]|nr:zinc-ribbon domain-containing protein [Gammaproteobacteria bacterium]